MGSTFPFRRKRMYVAAVAPASRAMWRMLGMSCSLSPGMTGAIETAVGIPASDNFSMASSRLEIEGACGSTFLAVSLSGKGNAEIDADPSLFIQLLYNVQVSQDEAGLRDNTHGVLKLSADGQALPSDSVCGFQRLVAICVTREHDKFALPGGLL